MENIFNRLQFVRGLNQNREDGIFDNREDAISYVLNKHLVDRPSLVAEPIFLAYENTDSTKDPYVILAIGSVGDGTPSQDNRTFFIDTQKTEEEIIALDEKVEEAIKSLILVPLDSPTFDISTEKTDEGTVISGDVKIADYRIVSGKVNENIIQTEGEKGLYAFVDMNYDPETFVITFNVNGATKEFQIPSDQHVVKGWYDPKEESIFLKLADDSQVKILVTKLIEEWTVLENASTTPIVLHKEHVSAITEDHEGLYDWQDVLEADVRVADHISDNIIHKDRTGRYLYVKGTADNIKYKDGVTVKEALDSIDTKVSTSTGNLIYKRPDGIYAYAMLDYSTAENKLIYNYTDGNTQETKSIEFKLNSVKLLEDITYDPVKEEIVIRYIDAQGEYQRVEIPVKDIIEEWDVNNEAHNILLNKYRSQGQGKDILSADAKIHNGDNNILEDKNHELYVNGISDNIKYDVTGDTTVKNVLDSLSASTESLDEKINQEIEDRIADVNEEQTRAELAEQELTDKIGTGFTSDPHENVTYKFEELSNNLNSEIERATNAENTIDEKVDSEIERATNAETILNEKIESETTRATEKETELDGKIEAIEDEIGEGFGPRNTVRDEINNLQSEIEAVSADSASSIKDIINIDESINIDKTDQTKPVISVNLSEEIEDNRYNIVKLNADGLFANVDLSYEPTANKLILHTSNGRPDKEIQLDSMSSIISIEYNPSKEAIVITYMTNGHEVKTVEIPVGDLINEWRVEDGHPNAVKLDKVRIASGTSEQDILKAAVVITDGHDDNILVMDGGALYVPGAQIAANAEAISGLTNRIEIAEADIDALENGLASEISRATSEEQRIESKLDSEITRSTTKDSELETALNNEITRSTNKDQELTDAINAETTRALSAETALYTAITNEKHEREASEALLKDSLDDEIERSIAKDNELQTSINNVESNLANEVSRATNAESTISNNLSSEIERATSSERDIANSVSTETNRATAQEEYLLHLIEDETEKRVSGDTINSNAISAEESRAREAETRLETSITNEVNRAQTKENELNTAITNETIRANAADTELYQSISDETAARTYADAVLETKISNEATARDAKDTILETKIDTEVSRSTAEDERLSNLIASETAARQEGDAALADAIRNATLVFEDTHSVDFTKDANNTVTAKVKLANAPDNIILIDEAKDGVYASVDLDYEPSTNKIKFKVNGEQKEFTIAAGSILEDAWYDQTTKELVFKTKTAEGEFVEVRIPAYDLFDDWYVVNPPADSAIELTKVTGRTDPTTHEPLPDELSGRVLISPLEDNMLMMDTNGLYVPGSGSSLAQCVDNKVNKVYKVLYGDGAGIDGCGENISYVKGNGCIISAATSFSEADQLLNDAFCSFIDNWEIYGFDTPSNHTDWLQIGQNRHMLVDTRLSHGSNAYESGMTDEELTISKFDDDYIDPTKVGFTDTNVIRIVNIEKGKSGETLEVDNLYNGIYLSNSWDCGLYYGMTAEDQAAKAAAEAEGYNTNYSTDEDEGASNYDYMNNVRQNDI